jgi:methyl coenzyme M reductase beta subunit
MKFKVKIYDKEGKELEIENKVIGHIVFESEEAIDFFINAIKSSLPVNFEYIVIPEKEANKNS